jgi:predicted methyltransferase
VAGATLAGALLSPRFAAAQAEDRLRQLVDGPQRSAANRARDPFRRPYESLAFLGVKPESTVVEIIPGAAAYWTEILAPYLKDRGLYIAAGGEHSSTSAEVLSENSGFASRMAADPASFSKVQVTQFKGEQYPIAPDGTADFVLTFRNLHNWMARGDVETSLAAFRKALKPGGVVGIEDHRGRTDQPQDQQAKSGYVRQDYTIALFEKAGFAFAGASEVNANPKDAKDYAVGVWALPPTYRNGQADRARYEAIGESDRYLLKFTRT